MLPQEIIRKKRDKKTLTSEEIHYFVAGITSQQFADSQITAMAMAIFFNGLDLRERTDLTREMVNSGDTLSWQDLDLTGPLLDKHSSGGVGDKVSLMLAPIVAACGGFVPMISGRGLGHTGGTLDKMDSIKGYQTVPDNRLFRKTVQDVGCAIIGQTGNLAPADKRFYSLRDISATVESVPLITASILSKKIAAGLDGLVMDIKTGNGAFAAHFEMALELSKSIMRVAQSLGLKVNTLITDMNQVLGTTAGNAVEVFETASYLSGEKPAPRLHEVVINLAAEMLLIGGLVQTLDEGLKKANTALTSGKAAEVFNKMVAALGGPHNFIEQAYDILPKAPVIKPCLALKSGYVSFMDTRAIGLIVLELGGGRTHPTQKINHCVGLSDIIQCNDRIEKGTPLGLIHAQTEADFDKACLSLQRAIVISDEKQAPSPVIIRRISGEK